MSQADEFASFLWELIERTECQKEALRKEFEAFDREAIIDCRFALEEAKFAIWDSHEDVFLEHGTSDDGKHDVCEYAVCQGRDHFNSIMQRTAKLKVDVQPGDVAFSQVADAVFYERFDEDLAPLIQY